MHGTECRGARDLSDVKVSALCDSWRSKKRRKTKNMKIVKRRKSSCFNVFCTLFRRSRVLGGSGGGGTQNTIYRTSTEPLPKTSTEPLYRTFYRTCEGLLQKPQQLLPNLLPKTSTERLLQNPKYLLKNPLPSTELCRMQLWTEWFFKVFKIASNLGQDIGQDI